MKKTLRIAAAIVAALGLSACNSDGDVSYNTSVTVAAYNLFTTSDGSLAPTAIYTSYSVTSLYPDMTLSISSPAMGLPAASSISFATASFPFSVAYYNVDGTYYESLQFDVADASASSGSNTVTDLAGAVTLCAYPPADVSLTGYTPDYPGTPPYYLVMGYTLNDRYNVRTFWCDMTFRGTTVVISDTTPFSTSETEFRIVMQRNGTALTSKADIVVYNARLSSDSDLQTLVLKDLDLEFTNSGYTVAGSSLAPWVADAGGDLAQSEQYTVDSFKMTVSGNLTSGYVSAKVNNLYNITFTGKSIADS